MYPLTSQILQCYPLRDFWRETIFCHMSCDLEVTNESVRCCEKYPCYITKPFMYPHRSSSGNTLKDSSEEGQPLPPTKPKDKVSALLAFIARPEQQLIPGG